MNELSTSGDINFIEEVDNAILQGIAFQRKSINLTYKDRAYLLSLSRKIFDREEINFEVNYVHVGNAIVFVSIYKNDQILACAYKQGKTLSESVILSTKKATELISVDKNSKNTHIEIAVLFDKKEITKDQINLGVDSLCLEYKNRIAIFKNSVPIKHSYTLEETLVKLAKKCGLESTMINSKDVRLSIFKTVEFREDILTKDNIYGLYDLYRGNPFLLQKEVTKKSLESSLKFSYVLFKKIAEENYFQAYLYFSDEKKWHDSNEPEAWLRKLASLWIFTKLAHFYQDKSGLKNIKKLINNIMKHFISDSNIGYIEINGIKDIGINGIFLLLLISSGFHQDKIILLKKFILTAHDKENKRLLPIVTPKIQLPHESEFFFPGIALNALLQVNKYFHEDENINTLEDVFPYYLALFRESDEGIKMMLWMSSAYTELFFITEKIKYAQFVFEMNNKVLDQQILSGTEQIDLIGSFSRNGNAAATASVAESLIDAYRLAKYLQDDSKAKLYRRRILMALRFILQAQYRPDNTFDLNVIGGYKNNFFDRNIRIDNIQHAAHAIYKFLEYVN